MGNVALKFYVKSILKILDRSSKTAFFAILEALNFLFGKFQPSEIAKKIIKFYNLSTSKMLKWQFLELLSEIPKIDFT